MTFFFFGGYTHDSLHEISGERTERAYDLFEERGGKLLSAYALLGDRDLALIADLPGIHEAMLVSVGLTKLTGISFNTSPAVSMEQFDRLIEGAE